MSALAFMHPELVVLSTTLEVTMSSRPRKPKTNYPRFIGLLMLSALVVIVGFKFIIDRAQPLPTTTATSASDLPTMTTASSYDPIAGYLAAVKRIPIAADRETLLAMIHTGRVRVLIDPVVSHGSFGALCLESTAKPYVFNMALTPSPSGPEATDSTLQMLVAYHEFKHLEQVRSGRFHAAGFVTDAQITTTAEAIEYFRAEEDAYVAECQLADRIGYRPDYDLFNAWRQGGRPQLKRWMFDQMTAMPWVASYRRELERYVAS